MKDNDNDGFASKSIVDGLASNLASKLDGLSSSEKLDILRCQEDEALEMIRRGKELLDLNQKAVAGIHSNWQGRNDVTMSDDMETYRQDLRDLPASTADSEDVVWPTKP